MPTSVVSKAPRVRSRRREARQAAAIAATAGLVAALAPLTLTGAPPVDAIQRMIFVASLSFVGSHGRRKAWLIAGAVLAVAARDQALLFTLAGLAVAVWSSTVRRRDRRRGALAVGLLANTMMWLPGHSWSVAVGPAVAIAIVVMVASGLPNIGRRHRRTVIRSFAVLAGLVLLGFLTAGFTTVIAYPDVDTGSTAARAALAAVRSGDTDTARTHLVTAQEHLSRANDKLSGPGTAPARLVPILAQQVNALDVSVAQALAVTETADDLLTTNYEDLRYDGRVDIDRLVDLEEPSGRVAAVLGHALHRLDELNNSWIAPPLRRRIDTLDQEIQSAHDDAQFANQVLSVAPGLLGADGPRHYLVAFITPSELRGAGGFIGSWAELEADDGRVELNRSGRIADLIYADTRGTRTLAAPADYVNRYGRYEPQEFVQDITFSPNFPSNAEAFANTYAQSGGREVDGVIAVDPTGLAALLTLTGPVDVVDLDEPITADNIVDLLTRDQYLRFGERAEREEVLADASRATFERLTNTSLPSPRVLGDVLGPATHGRHLQLWSRQAADQDLFVRLGADGALSIPAGVDGFQVVQQNAGNNKIDAYLQRRITYDATVDPGSSKVVGTLTVELSNNVPSLDLPDAVVGNTRAAPLGTNVTTVAVHTHSVVTAATIDGRPVKLGRGQEAGMFAWDTPVLHIPPGGTVTLVLEVEGGVDLSNGYRLLVLPQPVANPDVLDITVRSAGTDQFAGTDVVDGSLRFTGAEERPADLRANFGPRR